MFADDLTGGESDAIGPSRWISALSEYLAETVLTGLSDEFGRERPFNGNLRPPTNIIAKGSEQGLTCVRYWTDAPAIQFRGDRIPPEFPQFRNRRQRLRVCRACTECPSRDLQDPRSNLRRLPPPLIVAE